MHRKLPIPLPPGSVSRLKTVARWHHPDRIDRIAASRDSGRTDAPPTASEVTAALTKALGGGGLARLPRHPGQRDVVLAILCLDLERRRAYTEPEVNAHLQQALARLKGTVDHVSCRRYLVELGFLRRDRAGTRYFVNYPRLEAVLAGRASGTAGMVLAEVLGRARPTSTAATRP